MTHDVAVLGGGIIGAAIAEELARRGRSVALVERGTIGCEASTAAAGILSSQMDIPRLGPFFDLCQASHRLYPAWIRRLQRATGIDCGYHRDGILYVTLTAGETALMRRRAAWQRRLGLQAEEWSPREVAQAEPALSDRIRAGFVFRAEAQVDNPLVLRALAEACRRSGVTVREGVTAIGLSRRVGVTSVGTSHGTLRARAVVSCLGCWSGQPDALPRLPVISARGQILCFDAPKRLFRHVVMAAPAYGVQRRDGRLLVGSTIEFGAMERAVTLPGIRAILSGFARLVRPEALQQCTLRQTWAGLRPYSQLDVPILGQIADGLFVAAGHYRHGILLAPITAQVMAGLVLTGRSPVVDAAPFTPGRLLPARRL